MMVYSYNLFGRYGFLVYSVEFMICDVNLVGKIILDYYFLCCIVSVFIIVKLCPFKYL